MFGALAPGTSTAAIYAGAYDVAANQPHPSGGVLGRETLPMTVVGAVELSESAIIILSPVAMDEMFELFDNKLLITDNTFHHVANRNYTD